MKLLHKGSVTLFDGEGKQLVDSTDHHFFMYTKSEYNTQNLLKGFLKGKLMIKVCYLSLLYNLFLLSVQAFKAIFTSLSSARASKAGQVRATKKGNAALSNMAEVTPGSITYIATQVCVWIWYCCDECMLTMF